MKRIARIIPCIGLLSLHLSGCTTAPPPKLLTLDQAPNVAEDHGILVIEHEASEQVQRLEIKPTGRSGSMVNLRGLPPGRHVQIIVLPAGSYRWSEIDMKGNVTVNGREYPMTWRIARSDSEMRFSVRAGVVNYPGVLVLKRVSGNMMQIFTINRSAQFIEALRTRGRELLDNRVVVYSGRGRDDFLEYYTTQLSRARNDAKPIEHEPTRTGGR